MYDKHYLPESELIILSQKPSSLWPPPPPALTDEMQNRLRSKIKEAVSRMRNDPSRAEVHHRRASVFSDRESAASPVREMQEVPEQLRSSDPRAAGTKLDGQSKSDLHPVTEKVDNGSHPEPQGEPHHKPSRANPGLLFQQLEPLDGNERRGIRPTTLAQDSTPLSLEVDGESVAIDTQIQLYATNGQLCHPWVSPVLGYLGGLPPLYICCGANEVLRDEIIYM
jgi:hypothetical protein